MPADSVAQWKIGPRTVAPANHLPTTFGSGSTQIPPGPGPQLLAAASSFSSSTEQTHNCFKELSLNINEFICCQQFSFPLFRGVGVRDSAKQRSLSLAATAINTQPTIETPKGLSPIPSPAQYSASSRALRCQGYPGCLVVLEGS